MVSWHMSVHRGSVCNPARMDVGSAIRVKKGMIDSTAMLILWPTPWTRCQKCVHICPAGRRLWMTACRISEQGQDHVYRTGDVREAALPDKVLCYIDLQHPIESLSAI